jgi:Rps23 Pro-64 3,4-dihydroxylase Tpa1-like proline 4-hydroxylase
MDINLINNSHVAVIDDVIPEELSKKLADYAIHVKKNNIDVTNIADLDIKAESDENVKYWREKNLYLKFCDQEYEDIGIALGSEYLRIFQAYLSKIGKGSYKFDAGQIVPIVVHVYQEGDSLDLHEDGRDFALVFYLNEPEEFTGGDLVYKDLGIRIAPKRGRLVIAPSSESHEVLKVTSGYRCSMTVFVEAKP